MADFEAPEKYITYGTAGFRDDAKYLPIVLYRVGRLAALRSRFLGGKTVGVMITASHNPPRDNGAKLIDPLGEMLDQSWEKHATKLANASSNQELNTLLDGLYASLNVDRNIEAQVMYARDTRDSGPVLVEALEAALKTDNAHGTNSGVLTTPQLHYLVRAVNTLQMPGHESYGVPTEEGYFKKLATSYKKISTLAPHMKPVSVTVDCANGVGAAKLVELAPLLKGLVEFDIVNGDIEHPDTLNENCGADYVKTNQRLPANVKPETGKLYASFDGDADRVVCYYTTPENEFRLLDGDKIASLAASLLREEISNSDTKVDIGVVQTAYANGASTHYIEKELQIPVVFTPTGVKHLHHAAAKFGIGVYFEANGHGTVLFDCDTIESLRAIPVTSPVQKQSVDILLALSDLINQTVGDAISDLLMVLVILAIRNWSPAQWDASYTELPNRLLKCNVRDRTMFSTTDAERRLVSPEDLQPKLDNLMTQYPQSRTFVRASGTEDVVRVYSEAETQEAADDLAAKVLGLLKAYA